MRTFTSFVSLRMQDVHISTAEQVDPPPSPHTHPHFPYIPPPPHTHTHTHTHPSFLFLSSDQASSFLHLLHPTHYCISHHHISLLSISPFDRLSPFVSPPHSLPLTLSPPLSSPFRSDVNNPRARPTGTSSAATGQGGPTALPRTQMPTRRP